MQEALLSHGGVSGVRVAVLYTVPEIIQQQKFPGISKLHNFEFGDGALVAWRACDIGSGKRFVVDKSTGQVFNKEREIGWNLSRTWLLVSLLLYQFICK